MRPGSHRWRGVRRQRTGSEVTRRFLSYWQSQSPFCCDLWTRLAFGGALVKRGGDRECVRVCVNTRVQACACLLHVLGHIICHRINQPFQFSSKISLYRSPLSLSVQTFYCINLLKHFRMFSRVIWERDSQQRNAVLLRLALPFANMPFIFIPTETLYARVGKYPPCVVFFFCSEAEWHRREWCRSVGAVFFLLP